MKKVILSESQLKMLKESSDLNTKVIPLLQKMSKIGNEVDVLFSKTEFLTIGGLISGDELDISLIDERLFKLSNILHELYMTADSYVDGGDEEELQTTIYDTYENTNAKLDALHEVVNKAVDIKDYANDLEMGKYFNQQKIEI